MENRLRGVTCFFYYYFVVYELFWQWMKTILFSIWSIFGGLSPLGLGPKKEALVSLFCLFYSWISFPNNISFLLTELVYENIYCASLSISSLMGSMVEDFLFAIQKYIITFIYIIYTLYYSFLLHLCFLQTSDCRFEAFVIYIVCGMRWIQKIVLQTSDWLSSFFEHMKYKK